MSSISILAVTSGFSIQAILALSLFTFLLWLMFYCLLDLRKRAISDFAKVVWVLALLFALPFTGLAYLILRSSMPIIQEQALTTPN
ncbi:MAG: hypothetical protein CMJ19_13190 [Phycisphaeraceae bacterium]|nr:hypothetical protein [Phycisphaeraceae bacterium]